jgi:hypothetical protein
MKKIALAAIALAASFTAAAADEMPIKGTCTAGPETVTFTGSRMPVNDPLTGDFGVTQIFMDIQSFNRLGVNPHVFGTGPDGFSHVGFGELGGAVKTDPASDTATIRMSTGNFKLVFEGRDSYGLNNLWTCKISPNF